MLASLGFSLQGSAKTAEGSQHGDRDAQFRYLAAQVTEHAGAASPWSASTPRRRSSWERSRTAAGRTNRPGHPSSSTSTTSPYKELGKATPYGIDDVSAGTGWVSVGTDHDTPAFAVATLRTWWDRVWPARSGSTGSPSWSVMLSLEGPRRTWLRCRQAMLATVVLVTSPEGPDGRWPPKNARRPRRGRRDAREDQNRAQGHRHRLPLHAACDPRRLSVSSTEGVGPRYIWTGGHLKSGSWALTEPWVGRRVDSPAYL